MRLDTVLDSFYTMSSLWGMLPGHQVCTSNPYVAPSMVHATIAAGVTAFVDINVVPMDSERVLANQTVLVDGGRIVALGPVKQVKVPNDAVRIDGRGKYLMPGLGDMHPHRSPSESQLPEAKFENNVADGVTTIRYMAGGDLQPEQAQRYFAASAVPVPRLYIAPKIPQAASFDSLVTYYTAAKAAGYNHVGVGYELSRIYDAPEKRAIFDTLVMVAKRIGLPLVSHADPILPIDAMTELGATGGSSEHIYTFLHALKYPQLYDSANVIVSDVSMPELKQLAEAAKRAGIWITPTLSCTENKYSPTPSYEKVMQQIVKALQDAGVGLLLGADDGWSVHDELAALVRAGLTPYQALVTGTRNPAAFYQLLDSTGTVAVGKRADLVVLTGNPLANIGNAKKPVGVMIDGRWLDLAAGKGTP